MAVRQPRLLASLVMVLGLSLLGGVAIGWSAAARDVVGSSVGAEAPYTVICNACGQKTRFQDPPPDVLPRQDGLLRCPSCSAYSAVWHRRGSTSVPPGGF